jgi:hypothetical protein
MQKTAAGILVCFASLLVVFSCSVREDVEDPGIHDEALTADTPCTMQLLWGPINSKYAGSSMVSADAASQQCKGFYQADLGRKKTKCINDCTAAGGTKGTISPVLNPNPNDPTGMTGGPAFSFCKGEKLSGGTDSSLYDAAGNANFFCYCCL